MKPALENSVARAVVELAKVNGRTLVQITGLDEDTHDLVELLQPYGYFSNPLPGTDVLELHVLASGSHKVALGGDNTADSVANAQPGECGMSRGGQLVALRLTGINIVSPLFQWGLTEEALNRMITEKFKTLFNTHTHDVSGGVTEVPNQLMDDTYLTGGS